ncbi:MAG: hypothetical protein HY744_33360 [Deltaproteobacteria bacterium]|nr:hypothetical protein [Deltaproteobacteria bacterium]
MSDRKMVGRRLVRAAWCIVLCCLVQCHLPGPARPDADASPPYPVEAFAVARRLPADTLALVLAPDPLGLLDRLGRRGLVARNRDLYERAMARLVQDLGLSPLSPRGLREMGIEPHAPAGAAWLRSPREAAVLFVTLADEDRFKTRLYEAAVRRSVRLEPEVQGGALVIRQEGDEGVALVLAGRLALAAIDQGGGGALGLARDLAALPAGLSLARSADFREAMSGLGQGADLVGFVNVRGALFSLLGRDPRFAASTHRGALLRIETARRRALGAARARGASVEELVNVDDEYREAAQGLRDDPESRGLRQLAGALGGVGLVVNVDDGGVRARARLALEPGSLPARLLRSPTGPARLEQALGQRPSALAQVAFDPAVLSEMLGLLGYDERAASQQLGVELGELRRVLAGELEAALVHAPRADGEGRVLSAGEVRLAALVQLAAPAKAGELLAKLAQDPRLGSVLRVDTAAGGAAPGRAAYLLELPGLAPAALGVRGDKLVLGTGATLFERVGGAARGPARLPGAELPHAGPGLSLLGLRPAAHSELDLSLLAFYYLGLDYGLREPPTTAAAEAGSEAPPGGVSDEVARTRAELRRVEQQMVELRTRLVREARERELAFAERLGRVSLSVRTTSDGLEASLRYAGAAPSLVDLVDDLIERLRREDASGVAHAEWERLDDLAEQRYLLETKLRVLSGRGRGEDGAQPEAVQNAGP